MSSPCFTCPFSPIPVAAGGGWGAHRKIVGRLISESFSLPLGSGKKSRLTNGIEERLSSRDSCRTEICKVKAGCRRERPGPGRPRLLILAPLSRFPSLLPQPPSISLPRAGPMSSLSAVSFACPSVFLLKSLLRPGVSRSQSTQSGQSSALLGDTA